MVICSYNGAASIAAAVAAVRRQDYPGRVRLVVVDDGSTDGTAELAERAGATVVRHGVNRGVGAARDTGWRAVDAPLVGFVDDDCAPEPGWLSALAGTLERFPDCGVAGGPIRASSRGSVLLRYLDGKVWAPGELDLVHDHRPWFRLRRYLRSVVAPPRGGSPRVVGSLSGANMLWRRAALEAIGGFDARFRFGGEEEDACRRATRGGHPVMFTADAVMAHRFDDAYRDVARRAFGYGRGNARTWLKDRRGVPGLFPFPVLVAALLLAAPASPVPAALAAGAAGAPLLLYPRYLLAAARHRRAEPLAYAYLHLFEEACAAAGLAGVLLASAGRRAVPLAPRRPL